MSVHVEEHKDVGTIVRRLLDEPRDEILWFRGQGCASRQLQPSLMRRLMQASEPEALEEERLAAKILRAEQSFITRFRQRSLPYWPEGYPQSNWEHLFSMQHYGVPTRLLDWSENVLTASYFAADHDPQQCECILGDCRPTIWVLNPAAFNRANSRLRGIPTGILATSDDHVASWAPEVSSQQFALDPIAMYGTHNSTRVVAQQGTFTVAGKSGVPLEDSPYVSDRPDLLVKLVLDQDHDDLLHDLRVLGVRRSSVFPDLTGLAHDIASEGEGL